MLGEPGAVCLVSFSAGRYALPLTVLSGYYQRKLSIAKFAFWATPMFGTIMQRKVTGIRWKDRWHRGVAVERRTRDQEVAGSSLSRALWHKNSGQVSHTYVPLSPSSIIWYR